MLIQLAAAGTAAGLAAGACAYAANWPTSQLFGRTIVAGRDAAEIALTFDDGPNGASTLRLLEILARHNARASFFMIGKFVRQQPEVVRAVRDAGHLVGNHTMNHPALLWQKPLRVLEELTTCNHLLEDVLGQAVRYFRPPYGSRRPDVLKTAASLGLAPVMWNVTCYDWNHRDPNFIVERARRGIASAKRRGDGSNILLHDGGHESIGMDRSATVTATDTLLAQLTGTGVRLVTPDIWLPI